MNKRRRNKLKLEYILIIIVYNITWSYRGKVNISSVFIYNKSMLPKILQLATDHMVSAMSKF